MSIIANDDYTSANLYRDNEARLDSLFKIYSEIYDLPHYLHTDSDIVPEAFEYAKKRKYFVILVLHTKDGHICFQRSFDTGHLSMNLPGASIILEEEDTIVAAVKRVARESFTNARVADIAPIISLTNRFICQSGEEFEHHGLGVRALLLNRIQDIEDLSKDKLYKGKFLQEFPVEEIPHPPAQETYSIFAKWFSSKRYTTYTNEIETQHEVLERYILHQKCINPCMKILSKVFGDYSVKNVKEKIAEKISNVDKAIDIACGDDRGIFDLLNQAKLFVANDIAVDQIRNMHSQYSSLYPKLPKSSTLLFTNHDCLDLPFKEKAFDVAICQNILHHMNTADDLQELLRNLDRIASRILRLPLIIAFLGHKLKTIVIAVSNLKLKAGLFQC